MKLLFYSVVYCCLVLGLFVTFLYLMTVVDPGLMELADPAAAMIRVDRGEEPPHSRDTLLASADYMDIEILKNKTPNKQ